MLPGVTLFVEEPETELETNSKHYLSLPKRYIEHMGQVILTIALEQA